MRGFRFEVFTPVTVGALAVFDVGADGWTGEPTTFVGLWSETNTVTPLATAEVSPTSPLDPTVFSADGQTGQHRFVELATPVALNAGFYRVAAELGDQSAVEEYFFGSTPTGVNPAIGNFADVQSSIDNGYPSQLNTNGVIQMGGNFMLTAVPEPSAFMLLGLVGLVVASSSRCRHRSEV